MPWSTPSIDLGKSVSLAARRHSAGQNPELLNLNFTSKQKVFLGEDRPEEDIELRVFYSENYKSWVLNAGLMQGIPSDPEAIRLYLFDQFYREADSPNGALTEAGITRVERDHSVLDASLVPVNRDLIFRAYFKEIPQHKINVREQQGRLSIWSKKSMFGLNSCWKALYTESEEEAEVVVTSSEVRWKRTGKTYQLEAPMTKAADPSREVEHILGCIAMCERLIALDNTAITQRSDIQCQFTLIRRGGGDVTEMSLQELNTIDVDPNSNEGAAGYIHIDNQGEALAYVQLMFILAETLTIESMQHKAIAIPPGTGLSFGPLDLTEFQSDQMWLKLFSASEPFDVRSWRQEGLEITGF
jgi:hypothetical protein